MATEKLETILDRILDTTLTYLGIPLSGTIPETDLEKINNLLPNTISSKEIETFLVNEIYENIPPSERQKIPKDRQFSKLSNLGISIDFEAMSLALAEGLNKLPNPYLFLFKMPKMADDLVEVPLSTKVSLFTLTKEDVDTYFGRPGLRDLLNPKASLKDSFLSIMTHGYVGGIDEYHIREYDPVFIWKSIMGIFLSFKAFDYNSSPWRPIKQQYAFHVYDDKNEFIRSFEETTDDENFLHENKFSHGSIPDGKGGTMTITEEKFNNSISVLQNLLDSSRKKRVRKNKQRILNSSYWFYEASKSRFEYLKIIYLITAFESLILGGDKDRGDATTLVKELVSNTIARSFEEQGVIFEDLSKLYSLRNTIIHGEDFSKFLISNPNIEEVISNALNYVGRYIRNRASLLKV